MQAFSIFRCGNSRHTKQVTTAGAGDRAAPGKQQAEFSTSTAGRHADTCQVTVGNHRTVTRQAQSCIISSYQFPRREAEEGLLYQENAVYRYTEKEGIRHL
ncbi:hypothetical protein Q9966_013070 [Columba livia]|nr:hypothetical protein Q9966_013070 [Columba livia]